MTLPRLAALAALIFVVGCDAVVPETATADLKTDRPLDTRFYKPIAEYEIDHTLDVEYSLTAYGKGAPHTVSFLDKERNPVIEYRYLSVNGDIVVQARWPGVPSDNARLVIYDGEIRVHETAVAAVAGKDGGWTSLGGGDTPGMSIHVRPGRIQVDNNKPDDLDGVLAEKAQCAPPDVPMTSATPCTMYEVEFDIAIPDVHSVEVYARGRDLVYTEYYHAAGN